MVPVPRSELFRRVLLGWITALIVVRPLVIGEDPGMLRPYEHPGMLHLYPEGASSLFLRLVWRAVGEDPELLYPHLANASNLLLILFWLVTALGWSVWRICSGERAWHGSLVEIGLLAVVGLMFLSAARAASYKNPAWIIAWEWLGLFLVFFIVRQLVRTPGENQRLLAALLASGVSLAVYALYQQAVELPQLRASLQEDADPQSAPAPGSLPAETVDFKIFRDRIEGEHISASFVHAESFASFLVLLLPAGVGWMTVSWLRRGRPWQNLGGAACSIILLSALCLTHSRGALLSLLLVALFAGLVPARSFLKVQRGWLLVGLLGLAGVLVLYFLTGSGDAKFQNELIDAHRAWGRLVDAWSGTWDMIRAPDHPLFFWLGVGPGNFGRHAPRYLTPTAFEEFTHPHNFMLEMWSTCGVFALAALLAALGGFFWHMRFVLRNAALEAPEEVTPATDELPRTYWEFYLGGLAGLALGFVFWAANLTGPGKSDLILLGGLLSGARSLIWLLVFALFESIPWTGSTRALAQTAGVAALLLSLTVSGGIGFPSVALPLWVMAALAINSLPEQPLAVPTRNWVGLILPIPLLAGTCIVYYTVVYSPVADCIHYLKMARASYAVYHSGQLEAQKILPGKKREEMDKDLRVFLERRIINPLGVARNNAPSHTFPQLQLARWYGELWRLRPEIKYSRTALAEADSAVQLDPEGSSGYLMKYNLNMLLARVRSRDKRSPFFREAANALDQLARRAPRKTQLRYQLADALFLADDRTEGRRQAEKALDLNKAATDPGNKLTDDQRRQLLRWLER